MSALDPPLGNARIAHSLLDVLAASGSSAERMRAEKALTSGDATGLRRSGWIASERLRNGFRAAAAGPELARRVGRALMAPHAIGLFLRYAGVASPEKAYRRCDRLLPREQPGDRFSVVHIEDGRARIEFKPVDTTPGDALFCSLRLGMLEALTPLYGLLPAHVTETACAHRGANACVYQVAWRRTPRVGLLLGSLAGVLLGGSAAASLALLAGLGGGLASAFGLLVLAAVVAAGRSLDLARQLDAQAGAGLGQLSLLDEVDAVLAEKMDTLARLETVRTEPARERPLGSSPLRARPAEPSPPALGRRLHDSLASLQRSLASLRDGSLERAAAETSLDACAEAAREIHTIGAELARDEASGTDTREPADLAEIVRYAVATASSSQPASLEVALEIETGPAWVRGEPFQLEQVVIQLIANAAQAMAGQGTVGVELRTCPEGYEVAVRDQGEGIDPELLEGLFDPFFQPLAGDDAGLGLRICYRIVNQHGGELLVHSEPNLGTRVAMVLPAAS